jgi:hypothetical protein
MFAQSTAAEITDATTHVDLTDHTLPDPMDVFWGSDHFAHKLMAKDATIAPFISSCQFQIGGTDTGQLHSDQRFARRRLRGGIIKVQSWSIIGEDKGAHGRMHQFFSLIVSGRNQKAGLISPAFVNSATQWRNAGAALSGEYSAFLGSH